MRCLGPRTLAHLFLRGLARRVAGTSLDDRGSAALEFGILLPVVLLVILGVIQYGYAFWSLETAAASAREAARRLVVGTDWGCTHAEAVDHASSPVVGGVPPTVTRNYHTEGGASLAAPQVGSLVTVTVSFQSLNMGLPFVPVPNGGVVTQTGVGRIEDVPPQRLACDNTQNTVVGGTY